MPIGELNILGIKFYSRWIICIVFSSIASHVASGRLVVVVVNNLLLIWQPFVCHEVDLFRPALISTVLISNFLKGQQHQRQQQQQQRRQLHFAKRQRTGYRPKSQRACQQSNSEKDAKLGSKTSFPILQFFPFSNKVHLL